MISRSARTLILDRTLSDDQRIHIIQGQQHVSVDQGIMLTTILGSCVSACLRDPVVGVGGMNHFLLPGENGCSGHTGRGANALRYGVHAMELLVNGLLQRGAQRSRLEAKLFGGARMMKGLTDVGELNASFAERFLEDEGIALVGGSLPRCSWTADTVLACVWPGASDHA